MPKSQKKPWKAGVKELLKEKPPKGWQVLDISGDGVYLLPNDLAECQGNHSKREQALVGPYKLVVEFFLLSRSLKGKISVRIALGEEKACFDHFWKVARTLQCPKPRTPSQALNTQSVAAWPEPSKRPVFQRNEHARMAKWVKEFLENPPSEMKQLLQEARRVCAGHSD
ncbi:MAG: hypothetical protein WCO68_02675 [Verrucomicrobiota bacterium]